MIALICVVVAAFLAFDVLLVRQIAHGNDGVRLPAMAPAYAPLATSVPTLSNGSPAPWGQPGSDPTQMAVTAGWVSTVAARTGIPPRALSAYADAQLVTVETTPDCHLTWTMLAGIGAVESGHGTFGGSTLRPDGTTTSRILGPPLDGSHGTRAVPATVAGKAFDGDPRWDHAIGPMQFIPSTWMHWGMSADGREPNPNDIDDAALTAARYLCAAGGDLITPDGWRAAIGAYNAPIAYAIKVTDLANKYARESLTP